LSARAHTSSSGRTPEGNEADGSILVDGSFMGLLSCVMFGYRADNEPRSDSANAPAGSGPGRDFTASRTERDPAGTQGMLHWSGAGVASWYDLAVAVLEEGRAAGLVTGHPRILPLTTADYPTPASRPASSVLETGRTRRLLDLPAVHWRAELRAMLGELR